MLRPVTGAKGAEAHPLLTIKYYRQVNTLRTCLEDELDKNTYSEEKVIEPYLLLILLEK